MNQRTALVVMLLSSIMIFGGFILYDLAVNKKIDRVFDESQGNQPATNWHWEDNWNSPVSQDIGEPQHQISTNDYSDALKKASEYKKPIFVYFSANWCTWCQKMKNEVLSNDQVKSVMKDFVYLYVDTDQSNLDNQFKIENIPHCMILNADGRAIKSQNGYMEVKQLISWLKF